MSASPKLRYGYWLFAFSPRSSSSNKRKLRGTTTLSPADAIVGVRVPSERDDGEMDVFRRDWCFQFESCLISIFTHDKVLCE